MVARVLFRERRVEIWDSLGPDPAAATYLANILHYIYDATTLTDNSPPSFSDWARRWTTTDKSHLCPRQRNGDDCGVFTILNTYLMAQGCQLRPNTYTQATITTRQLRRTLAHALWARRTHPNAEALLRPHRATYSTVTATTPRPARRTRSAKHRRRRRGDLVTTRRRGISHTQPTGEYTPSSSTLMNRKRSARSIATQASNVRKSTQRQLPTKKRRRLDPVGDQG